MSNRKKHTIGKVLYVIGIVLFIGAFIEQIYLGIKTYHITNTIEWSWGSLGYIVGILLVCVGQHLKYNDHK